MPQLDMKIGGVTVEIPRVTVESVTVEIPGICPNPWPTHPPD
jgi:hypothetical protein